MNSTEIENLFNIIKNSCTTDNSDGITVQDLFNFCALDLNQNNVYGDELELWRDSETNEIRSEHKIAQQAVLRWLENLGATMEDGKVTLDEFKMIINAGFEC